MFEDLSCYHFRFVKRESSLIIHSYAALLGILIDYKEYQNSPPTNIYMVLNNEGAYTFKQETKPKQIYVEYKNLWAVYMFLYSNHGIQPKAMSFCCFLKFSFELHLILTDVLLVNMLYNNILARHVV